MAFDPNWVSKPSMHENHWVKVCESLIIATSILICHILGEPRTLDL